MEFADSADHGAFNDRSVAGGVTGPSGELIGTSLSANRRPEMSPHGVRGRCTGDVRRLVAAKIPRALRQS